MDWMLVAFRQVLIHSLYILMSNFSPSIVLLSYFECPTLQIVLYKLSSALRLASSSPTAFSFRFKYCKRLLKYLETCLIVDIRNLWFRFESSVHVLTDNNFFIQIPLNDAVYHLNLIVSLTYCLTLTYFLGCLQCFLIVKFSEQLCHLAPRNLHLERWRYHLRTRCSETHYIVSYIAVQLKPQSSGLSIKY